MKILIKEQRFRCDECKCLKIYCVFYLRVGFYWGICFESWFFFSKLVSSKVESMGLCKCPLKKVTNLFCFECRVNVCETCLLSTHSQCIVQTYLKWLQDSEYVPNCRFCNDPLSAHPTIRLLCLHVFHKQCLTKYAQSLPATTAPGGYTCITCQEGIFPEPSNKSAIAEALRSGLATETWARPGLGLPVVPRTIPPPIHTSTPMPTARTNAVVKPTPSPGPTQQQEAAPVEPKTPPAVAALVKKQDSSIPVGIVSPNTGSYDRSKVAVDSREEPVRPSVASFDCDEDKYRRRSLKEWLTRWLRLHVSKSRTRDDPFSANLRRWIVILIISLLFSAPRRWKAPCFTRLFYPTKNSEKMLKIPEKSKKYD
eukprot:sb/3465878/